MVKSNLSSDRKFKCNLRKFLLYNKPTWKYERLENGNYILKPRPDRYSSFPSSSSISSSSSPDDQSLSEYENSVLQAVALRAFLRPSKFLYERHLRPSVNWTSVRYCWSSFSKSTPVMDFWEPVPGVVCDWKIKIQFVIQCYLNCNLFSFNSSSNVIDINIKLGLDGTNLWKAKLETLSISFAHKENDLYKLPDACHLLMFYIIHIYDICWKRVLFNTFINI